MPLLYETTVLLRCAACIAFYRISTGVYGSSWEGQSVYVHMGQPGRESHFLRTL